MSEGNGIMTAMDKDFKDRCKEMADYFLDVFEKYWNDEDVDDRDVQFALYSNNLAFQLAWIVDYEYTDTLTDEGIEIINSTYSLLESGGY